MGAVITGGDLNGDLILCEHEPLSLIKKDTKPSLVKRSYSYTITPQWHHSYISYLNGKHEVLIRWELLHSFKHHKGGVGVDSYCAVQHQQIPHTVHEETDGSLPHTAVGRQYCGGRALHTIGVHGIHCAGLVCVCVCVCVCEWCGKGLLEVATCAFNCNKPNPTLILVSVPWPFPLLLASAAHITSTNQMPQNQSHDLL